MLWNTEVHSIDNLWIRYYISYFIQCIKNRFESFSFIMNCKSLYVLQKECFRLISTKNFCYIKE